MEEPKKHLTIFPSARAKFILSITYFCSKPFMKGFSVVLILLTLFSCSPKIKPEKPALAVTDFKLDSLPVSEINLPIEVNLMPFYAMAEKKVDTLFISPGYPNSWVQSACDTRYKYIFRRGPLQMKASGNSLNLGFTGYYRIIGSTRLCVASAAMSSWTAPCRCGFDEPERRVNVSFTNSINIQNDYKIRLQIKRNEPQPLDKCTVCFWGQDITKQVMNGLKEELDSSKAELDRSYGQVDLRPQFQQLWDQLNKAYNIYGMGWLQVNPQRFRINNLAARNDSLYVTLGLSAKPVISFEKPEDIAMSIPVMGDFNRRQGFSIFLDALLNYDSLSRLMNTHLSNKSFDLQKGPVKKKFIIKECKLSGSGNEKIIIRVDFEGTDKGTIYLTGKPVYNKESHILDVQQMDFDIHSKDALLKGADWLFNRKIVTEISRYTRFDLSSYIDTAKNMINRQLNKEWIHGISSYGNIQDIQLIGIYPLNQSLVIRSNCTGNLAVKVDAVDFSL